MIPGKFPGFGLFFFLIFPAAFLIHLAVPSNCVRHRVQHFMAVICKRILSFHRWEFSHSSCPVNISNCLNEQHFGWLGTAGLCLISTAATALCSPENGTSWGRSGLSRRPAEIIRRKRYSEWMFCLQGLTCIPFFNLASLFSRGNCETFFLDCFINNHPFELNSLIHTLLISTRL